QVNDDASGGRSRTCPRREPMTLDQVRAAGADEWLRVLAGVFAADRIPPSRILGLMRRPSW
ncbi:MAG TPA: hypothetical protein VFM37_12355, partial [Pseudonocardiaceae bacterium]|nr:hypothetical protein [Pseudonocardiaceae bacterium]